MYYSLNKEQELNLLSKPETGMGYQIIEAAQPGSYIKEKFVVLNSQMAVKMDSNQNQYIRKIMAEGFYVAKGRASEITFAVNSIKVFSEREYRVVHEAKSGNERGAIENKKEFADGTEVFIRLSAFENDLRIDKEKKCLRSGSFATTKGDYTVCKSSKLDPIERYALPSNDEIKWAFHIQPLKNDIIQRGSVQPANDKQGGGKEVFFESGTSVNTFLQLTAY